MPSGPQARQDRRRDSVLPINDLGRHADEMRSEILQAVDKVLQSGRFVLGPQVSAFEKAFAGLLGASWCVGVANGTEAIELALRAVGVSRGDEVVTVANAGGYSSTAIRSVGAIPHYVDVSSDNLLIDPGLLSDHVTPQTSAIIVTHLYGQTASMKTIRVLADDRAIPVIEDCAQSHGAVVEGRAAGTWGHLGCFSFYPTKNLGALGDGGAVVGGDEHLESELRRLRQYGWSEKYELTRADGRNSRLDELQAAILNIFLPRLAEWNAKRREVLEAVAGGIRHEHVTPLPRSLDTSDTAHLLVVRTKYRDSLRAHLAELGVGSDIHYPVPDHRQPASPQPSVSLPVTEMACAEVLTLPCFPEMTSDDASRVAEAVNRWRP